MHLDIRDYPRGHIVSAIIAEKLGVYVSAANFSEHNGKRMFRILIDSELSKKQLRELLFSSIKDDTGTYEFAYLETIQGPVIDQAPTRTGGKTYIRVTFM